MRLFMQKQGTTTRPAQPYGDTNGYGKNKYLFSQKTYRGSHKGAIPLGDVSETHVRGVDAGSRNSGESHSQILQKGVLVTKEYQVSTVPARSDEELGRSDGTHRW